MGHIRNARENSAGSLLTHPTKSSPWISFICGNISRSVIIRELYPVWTFEAIILVSSISGTGTRNSILQQARPDWGDKKTSSDITQRSVIKEKCRTFTAQIHARQSHSAKKVENLISCYFIDHFYP